MIATATATDVEQAYLAYFGRPADTDGLNYWIGQPIATMQAGFAASQEYANLYSGMTNDQRVEQVYQNLLGRPSDPTGKAYWVGLLNAGTVTVGTLVTTMLEDAQGIDISTIANRTTFAIDLTSSLTSVAQNAGYSGTASAAAARAAVSAVTYTTTSLETALNNMSMDIQAIDLGETPDTLAAANAATAAIATAAGNLAAYGSINGVTQTSAANTYVLSSGANTVNMVVGSAAVTDTFDHTNNPTSVIFNISGASTGALTLAKTGSQTVSTTLTINDSTAAALTVGPLHGGHLTSAVFNNTGTATLSAGITVGSILQSVSITGTGTENFTNITSANTILSAGVDFQLTDSSSAAVGIVTLTDSTNGTDSISNIGSGTLTIGTATLSAGNNTLTISSSGTGGITDSADTSTATSATFANTGTGTLTETAFVDQALATASVTGTGRESLNITNSTTALTITDSNTNALTAITLGTHTGHIDTTVIATTTALSETGFITGDVISISVASYNALVDGNAAAITSSTASGMTATITGNTTSLTAGTTELYLVGTIANDASLLAAIQGGSSAITFASSVASGKGFLVAYEDGTNMHIVEVIQGTAGTTLSGAAVHDVITLTGVTTITGANIAFHA